MKIYIYTDTIEREISSYVISAQITRSTLAPFHTLQLDLSIPLEVDVEVLPISITGAYALGFWIVCFDEAHYEHFSRAHFIGRCVAVSWGIEARTDDGGGGMLAPRPVSVRCESTLQPMFAGQQYLSSSQPIEGHVFFFF